MFMKRLVNLAIRKDFSVKIVGLLFIGLWAYGLM